MNVYNYFIQYFDDPLMTKYQQNDTPTASFYIARIFCLLGSECRYLVCIVPKDNYLDKTQRQLSSLKWIFLSTLTSAANYPLKSHTYIPKRRGDFLKNISLIDEKDDAYTYKCDNLPVEIVIKNKQNTSLPRKSILPSAIETFSATISHDKTRIPPTGSSFIKY